MIFFMTAQKLKFANFIFLTGKHNTLPKTVLKSIKHKFQQAQK